MALLDIRNLSIDYLTPDRGWINICKNLDFFINDGEICGLIGDSGSGKSMIAKALIGMYSNNFRVHFDRFKFNEIDLTHLNLLQRRKILSKQVAYIFQDAKQSLDPYLTIGAQMHDALPNSAFNDKWYKRFGWRRRTINNLLHKVGIKEPKKVIKKFPHELSEVLCKKIVIAMALGRKPKLLIADEPIANMTTISQLQILRLIASFNKNSHTTVLYICNDITQVGNLLNRINVVYAGSIIESNSTVQILSRPHHPYTISMIEIVASYLNQSKKTKFKFLPGDSPELGKLPIGCPLGPRCPFADRECNHTPPIIKYKGGTVACHFPQNMENSNND